MPAVRPPVCAEILNQSDQICVISKLEKRDRGVMQRCSLWCKESRVDRRARWPGGAPVLRVSGLEMCFPSLAGCFLPIRKFVMQGTGVQSAGTGEPGL